MNHLVAHAVPTRPLVGDFESVGLVGEGVCACVRGFVCGSWSARGGVGSVASWRRGCDFCFFFLVSSRRKA